MKFTKTAIQSTASAGYAVVQPYFAIGKGVLAVLIVCAMWYWSGRAADLKEENDALKFVVRETAKNQKTNEALIKEWISVEVATQRKLLPILQDVNRDRPTVDPKCAPALDPVNDAINGLRELQNRK